MSPFKILIFFPIIPFVFCNILEATLKSIQATIENTEEIFSTNINDPDFDLGIEGLITSKGYPFELHRVSTPDGYLLEVHRIPKGITKFNESHERQIVFLQHEIFTSSTDWVINFPYNSLGFILADAGYDVWMGNFRGNIYSKENIFMQKGDPAIFNFAIDEMALTDLPTMIDFVLDLTFSQKLFYIGYGMGNTAMFALLSERPEYGENKLHAVIALAPMTKIPNFDTPVRVLLPLFKDAKPLLPMFTDILGTKNEIFPNYEFFEVTTKLFCQTGIAREIFCSSSIYFLLGPESSQMFNVTRVPVYLSHAPAGTSVDTLLQYIQSFNGNFQKFDFGFIKNNEYYGQAYPPLYNTSHVTTPVALLSSSTDYISVQKDVDFLRETLPNIVLDVIVDKLAKVKIFSHIDFVYAINADKIVYNHVLNFMNTFPVR